MTLSEFRHGNIEVVREGLLIVVIATAEDREESLKHAEHLASLQAEVYFITDRSVSLPGITEKRILILPEQADAILSQIVAVLPILLLAEKTTSLKGADVDDFRYISKVVDRY
ncbi:hypothetical protein E2980_19415 [Cohnella luojiensis]|uniref:SIS domain-containing protein n=2 Tax=Cohnella luojiensis TaxID=652876 RepID=A0A4Y8LUE3_9BACL|nr:hypothetical protein E2980_19415 [Cohnella luojiensis]